MTKAPTAIKQLETARARSESLLSETLKVKGYAPEKAAGAGSGIGLTGAKAKRLAAVRAELAELREKAAK